MKDLRTGKGKSGNKLDCGGLKMAWTTEGFDVNDWTAVLWQPGHDITFIRLNGKY